MSGAEYDSIIIGGGFYGCILAAHLKRSDGQDVLLLEAEPDLLQKASYANQARVHNGYHYPRSLLTGSRARANFDRFLADYPECIVDAFEKYYAIGRHFSKVTASQFKLFCQRIGAPLEAAPKEIVALFNPHLIERVFRVREVAFDAVKLKEHVAEDLRKAHVEIRFNTTATQIRQLPGPRLEVRFESRAEPSRATARRVFNCTYARINQLLAASSLPRIPLKHEWTELVLAEMPEPLHKMGITVMCGPFFSLMPFPPRGLHSLSHVQYTPHGAWHDTPEAPYRDPYLLAQILPRKTHFLRMLTDAQRYLPVLKDCRYVDSIWATKTVLPRSEVDDSRPILFKKDYGLPGFTCIMGSKIDNVYDMIDFASHVHAL